MNLSLVVDSKSVQMALFNTIHSHIRPAVRGARMKNRCARLNRQLAQDIERSRFRLFLAGRSGLIIYILGDYSRVSSVLFINLVKIAHLGERGHCVVSLAKLFAALAARLLGVLPLSTVGNASAGRGAVPG
jgi:hypothetical protein